MIEKFNLNMWISTSEDGIHWEYRPNREDILKKINEIIDIVNAFEPKRGMWTDTYQTGSCSWGGKCSCCGEKVISTLGYNYCPNCGADMRGGKNG